MLKTFNLEMDENEACESELNGMNTNVDGNVMDVRSNEKVFTSRINIEPSPQFNAKIKKHDG